MDGSEERKGYLNQLRLFDCLTEEELEQMAEKTKVVQFDENKIIMLEGQKLDSCYVLLEGRALVFTSNNQAGDLMPIAEVGEDELLGELSLISGVGATSSVKAMTVVRCLSIDKNTFDYLMDNNLAFTRKLVNILTNRIRSLFYIVHRSL